MGRISLLLLAGLALAPAVAAAQDDEDSRCHRDRNRDREHCDRGLREVSDRRGSSRRDGFWAAVGIGAGSESFDAEDGLGWSDDKGGGIAYLKLGGTVNQSLLLGVEANVWGGRYRAQGYDRSLSSLMFIGQLYPGRRSDFWLRAGLGLARDDLDLYSGEDPTLDSHHNGTAFALGVGYDFRVGRNVSITPSIDLMGQRYRTHDERLLSFGVGITLH